MCAEGHGRLQPDAGVPAGDDHRLAMHIGHYVPPRGRRLPPSATHPPGPGPRACVSIPHAPGLTARCRGPSTRPRLGVEEGAAQRALGGAHAPPQELLGGLPGRRPGRPSPAVTPASRLSRCPDPSTRSKSSGGSTSAAAAELRRTCSAGPADTAREQWLIGTPKACSAVAVDRIREVPLEVRRVAPVLGRRCPSRRTGPATSRRPGAATSAPMKSQMVGKHVDRLGHGVDHLPRVPSARAAGSTTISGTW